VTAKPKAPVGRRRHPLYERLHNSKATLARVPHAPSDSVLYLSGAKHLLLEAERAGGEPVATTMCFAAINEKVYLRTDAASPEVRRIARSPTVKVAACTFRGTPFNDYIECTARTVPSERKQEAEAALHRQYGLIRRLLTMLAHNQHTHLELTPLTADRPAPDTETQMATVTAIYPVRHEHPPGAA
jgi:PPOX class probable F420-dependent enzyme